MICTMVIPGYKIMISVCDRHVNVVSLVKWLSSESSSDFITYIKKLRKLNSNTKPLCNINYFIQQVVIDYSIETSTPCVSSKVYIEG